MLCSHSAISGATKLPKVASVKLRQLRWKSALCSLRTLPAFLRSKKKLHQHDQSLASGCVACLIVQSGFHQNDHQPLTSGQLLIVQSGWCGVDRAALTAGYREGGAGGFNSGLITVRAACEL